MFPSLTRDKRKNDIDTIIGVGAGSFSDLSMIEDLSNQVTAESFVSNNHFVTQFWVPEKAYTNSRNVKKLSDSRNLCKCVFFISRMLQYVPLNIIVSNTSIQCKTKYRMVKVHIKSNTFSTSRFAKAVVV